MHKVFSFVKIEHTLFSLPMIYSGMALGVHANTLAGVASNDLWIKGLLILGAGTGARTIGFAINRIVDRHIDAKNPRTKSRDLPSGRMKLREAYLVLGAAVVLYLACAWALNPLCLALSPIPAAVFTVYPYLKRFTSLAHLGIGASLALGPLGGYFAVRPSLDGALPAILLTFFAWAWTAGFDIIYSTADEAFDRNEGLHSLPAKLGSARALQVSGFIHIAAFLMLVTIYLAAFRGSIVAAVLLLVAGILLFLEQKKASDIELAFFKINIALGFVVFLFVTIGVALA
jgi:4-hydroxybenzoate polyprenyltransferase